LKVQITMGLTNRFPRALFSGSRLFLLLLAGVSASASVWFGSSPVQAEDRTFVCGVSYSGIPTTYANTPRGQIVVVRWTSEYFTGAGYDPMTRCQEVSSRFERHRRANNLAFITAGYLNGQPAICAGNGGAPCSSDRLLFTLKPGSNAAARIQQLYNLRTGASSTPLYESTRGSGGGSSVDFESYLQNAPVENSGEGAKSPTAEPAMPAGPGAGDGNLF
jgi:hypothetical protein